MIAKTEIYSLESGERKKNPVYTKNSEEKDLMIYLLSFAINSLTFITKKPMGTLPHHIYDCYFFPNNIGKNQLYGLFQNA